MVLKTNFMKYLKQAIEKRGITVSKLSKATGIPNSTLANWLAGHIPKNVYQLKKVAEYFEISLDELIFGKPFKNKSLSNLEEEINAGKFEVILKRITKES